MRHFKILSKAEIEKHDCLPALTWDERKSHFKFSKALLDLANDIEPHGKKVRFLVLAVYFRGWRKFNQRKFDARDLRYVSEQLGHSVEEVQSERYDKFTYFKHRRLILDHFGYKDYSDHTISALRAEIARRLRAGARHRSIFYVCLEFLETAKVVAPTSFRLCQLINAEANKHIKSSTSLVSSRLTEEIKQDLDRILQPETPGRLKLSHMKNYSLSRKPKGIHENVQLLRELQDIFGKVKPALDAAELTSDGIQHYAGYVLQASSSQIIQKKAARRYFYLSAFVAHQFIKVQDTLIDIFLQAVQTSKNATIRNQKEQVFQGKATQDGKLEELGDLGSTVLTTLSHLKGVILSFEDDTKKVALIELLLEEVKESSERLRLILGEVLGGVKKRDGQYNSLLETQSRKLQIRLGGILSQIEFTFEKSAAPLEKAIKRFKENSSHPSPPIDFLNEKDRARLFNDKGKIRLSLYKTLLFTKTADGIKAGSINLRHSYKYKALDEYLIPKHRWEQERPELLRKAGLEKFVSPNKVLAGLSKELDEAYKSTNRKILGNQNPHVVMKGREFTLATPKLEPAQEEGIDLQSLFPAEKYIPLLEVLSTVDSLCSFSGCFEHCSERTGKNRPANVVFLAGIMGYGCGIINRIAHMSNIAGGALDNVINWYFSEEAVIKANNRLVEFMSRLRLPQIYREDSDYGSHTASDGQKFDVKADTIHASASFKYHGKGQGVSAISFNDERNFLYYSKVISSRERESAYTIDGLMHNDVVQSQIHSTDTHGYSELIFGATHLLNFVFAPRIKGLKRQWLYSFGRKADYEKIGFPLLPSGNVNEELIIKTWDEILRFIATIKLREATASDLFRRLNSYSKQHATYQALKAFGQITKSIFILRYIDDVEMRQSVEKELNKLENSNKMSRAIDIGDSKIEMDTIEELRISESCRRLIKNCIICWNYLYITNILINQPDQKRREAIHAAVRNGSIAAWRHINLLGEYDFSEEKLRDSIGFNFDKIVNYAEIM